MTPNARIKKKIRAFGAKYISVKILMLNNEYPPLGGGTGTVNQEIIEHLKNYPDLEIDLITGCMGNVNQIKQLSDNVQIIKLALNNKNIHHASNFELIKYTFKSFFYARKLQKKCNYDMSFSWSSIPAGFISYLLKIFYGLPYIVRIGGPDIPNYDKRYKTVYKLISPIIKHIWKNAGFIITKCQLEHDMVYAINQKLPLRIINNGIDLERFFAKQYINNQPIKVICPARLITIKAQDILIKAIAILKQKGIILQLNLVGNGDELENYQHLANELNVASEVHFKSYIPRDKMVVAYHEADIFVLPSYNEGMSNALLEAMACALTVVVTNVGGTSELVIEGENGFIFEKGNAEMLANILEKISKKPEILKEMGGKSRKRAEELDWDKIVTEYIGLINEINPK